MRQLGRARGCAALLALGACAHEGQQPAKSRPPVARAASVAPNMPRATAASTAADVPAPRPSLPLLVHPPPEPLAFELRPMAGGRRVLAVSEATDDVTWARTIDGASGALGPLWRFPGEHVVAAFDVPDGSTSVATSDGRRVCIARYPSGADAPDARGCATVSPYAIAPLGGRLALLELERVAAPAAAPHAARVAVRVRWATFAGEVDATSTPTGLELDRPFEGMALIDAVARSGAVDLAWYEVAPGRAVKPHLGVARFGAGTLRADGTFDPASRVAVWPAPLEHGALDGRRAPRLLAQGDATVLVTRASRYSPCEAVRVAPGLGVPSPAGAGSAAACAVDPAWLATRGPGAAEPPAFARIVRDGPRRAPLQVESDGPLVVWAGDRAFFGARRGGAFVLRSADHATGEARDEAPPFPARRAEVAWAAVDVRGDALAFAGGHLLHVAEGGDATPIELPAGVDARARAAIASADPRGVERTRAARIGDTWWLAREAVVRVLPSPLAPAALVRRAPADTTALVGGRERGIFLELAAGTMRATTVAAEGALDPHPPFASPVRFGFGAAARARGGAIVAGRDARDPTRLVAFTVDDDGAPSPAHPVAITVAAGDARLSIEPLPAGGALVFDGDRRHVAWLDDDAREVAHADVPGERSFPAILPGAFVDLGASATPASHPQWLGEGSLRWIARVDDGLDTAPAVVTARPDAPASSPPLASAAADAPVEAPAVPAPATRGTKACPPEMVLVAGRVCIDRFEDVLVDASTGEPLSPDYSATAHFRDVALVDFAIGRTVWGDVHARAFPLPPLAPWQRDAEPRPVAVSRYGARPNGYVRGFAAEAACAAAGKRLCSRDEFRTACRGEDDTPFPYGATYVAGACNVDRDEHPAAILHDNASIGHLDPRLDRVAGASGPLLRPTGATPSCRSRWGADAVYDLVGNLDEWIAAPKGAFAGGFYSRGTHAGCDAIITAHPKEYLDYSTGVRCCADAATPPP